MALWVQVATEVEEGRQAALVKARHFEHYLDRETIWSLHRQEERECLKREKKLLQDENQLLRDTVHSMEAKEGPTF